MTFPPLMHLFRTSREGLIAINGRPSIFSSFADDREIATRAIEEEAMGMGERTMRFCERLDCMSLDFATGRNERYFLIHATLLRLLLDDPQLILWPASDEQVRKLMSDAACCC